MTIRTQSAARFATVMLITVIATAAICADARAAIRKEAVERFIGLIDAVASKQNYFVGKEVSGYEYDFEKDAIWIGGKNGTGVFHNETRSSLKRDTVASKYTAVAHSEETGWSAGMRFGDYKKHSVRFGAVRRDITLEPYVKTINAGLCTPCFLEVSQADIAADSKFFTYTYDLSRAWALDAGYSRQKALLDTGMGQSLITTTYTMALRRETKKGGFAASLSEYKRSRISKNRHIRLSYTRKVWKMASLFVETGMYTKGLPTAEGAFSDLGDRFVFNYISKDSDFRSLYNEKFGYYSIGLKATFKFN